MPVILGVDLGWWLVGGLFAAGGWGFDKTANDMGDAAQKSQGLARILVTGGALYVAYRVMQKGGLAK